MFDIKNIKNNLKKVFFSNKIHKDRVLLGMMNFSVISKNNRQYKAGRKEYSEYKAAILNSERLKVREEIFFKYSVPMIIKKHLELQNKNVKFIFSIAISDILPIELIRKFELLEQNYEFFNIIKVSEDEQHDWEISLKSVLRKLNLSDFSIVGNFRLDDDDLLSSNYYDLLVEYLNEEYLGFYVTFAKGYVAFYDQGYQKIHEIVKPYLAIGLTKIVEYNKLLDVFTTENPIVIKRSHTSIVSNSQTILDSRVVSYVWTMSLISDTRSLDLNQKQQKSKIFQFLNEYEEVEKSVIDSFLIKTQS